MENQAAIIHDSAYLHAKGDRIRCQVGRAMITFGAMLASVTGGEMRHALIFRGEVDDRLDLAMALATKYG